MLEYELEKLVTLLPLYVNTDCACFWQILLIQSYINQCDLLFYLVLLCITCCSLIQKNATYHILWCFEVILMYSQCTYLMWPFCYVLMFNNFCSVKIFQVAVDSQFSLILLYKKEIYFSFFNLWKLKEIYTGICILKNVTLLPWHGNSLAKFFGKYL